MSPETTVLETILAWSENRPMWQRDALPRIVSKGRLDDNDLKELITLCRHGKGEPGTALTPEPLAKQHLPANPGQGASVTLLSIADVTGVNNLAPGQTLGFEPVGIIVVDGDNGAGKSGYVRILKRACRARRAGQIHPNVYASGTASPASATIAYGVGGVAQPLEK